MKVNEMDTSGQSINVHYLYLYLNLRLLAVKYNLVIYHQSVQRGNIYEATHYLKLGGK